jgi:hypothetical protein
MPKSKNNEMPKQVDLYRWYKIKEIANEVFSNYSFEIHWFKKCWLFLEQNLQNVEDGRFLKHLDEEEGDIPTEVFLWIISLYEIYFEFKISIELETNSTYPNFTELFTSVDIYKTEMIEKEFDERFSKDVEKYKKAFRKLFNKAFKEEFERLNFFVNGDSIVSLEEFQKYYTTINEGEIQNLDDYYFIGDNKYEEYKSTISIQNLEQYKIMQGLSFVNEL